MEYNVPRRRVRIAEHSDNANVYAHSSNGHQLIYSGTLSKAVHYAATYMERDSIMASSNAPHVVEVVLHGEIVTTFSLY